MIHCFQFVAPIFGKLVGDVGILSSDVISNAALADLYSVDKDGMGTFVGKFNVITDFLRQRLYKKIPSNTGNVIVMVLDTSSRHCVYPMMPNDPISNE